MEWMNGLMTSNYENFFGHENNGIHMSSENRFGNMETVVYHDAKEGGKIIKNIDVVSNIRNFGVDYKQQARHLE